MKQKIIASMFKVAMFGASAQSYVLYKNLTFSMVKGKLPKLWPYYWTLGWVFSPEKLLPSFENSFKLGQSISLLGVWIWDLKMVVSLRWALTRTRKEKLELIHKEEQRQETVVWKNQSQSEFPPFQFLDPVLTAWKYYLLVDICHGLIP